MSTPETANEAARKDYKIKLIHRAFGAAETYSEELKEGEELDVEEKAFTLRDMARAFATGYIHRDNEEPRR